MALITEQRIIDSNKRALLKYVITGNGTQNSNTVLVDVSTLALALNANGMIMSSNTHPKSKYNTTIKRATGFVSSNGAVKLQWHGDANSDVFFVGKGSFDFDFQSMGDGATISNPEASSNGDILLSIITPSSADSATIFIDMKKDGNDYDQGQTADPVAFNRGSAAP